MTGRAKPDDTALQWLVRQAQKCPEVPAHLLPTLQNNSNGAPGCKRNPELSTALETPLCNVSVGRFPDASLTAAQALGTRNSPVTASHIPLPRVGTQKVLWVLLGSSGLPCGGCRGCSATCTRGSRAPHTHETPPQLPATAQDRTSQLAREENGKRSRQRNH